MRTPGLVLAAVLTCSSIPALAADFPVSDQVWELVSVNGTPYQFKGSAVFPEPGRIAGSAPCNRYMGNLAGTLEEFAIGPLAATQMACADLDAEQTFLEYLQAVNTGKLSDDVLVLTDNDQVTLEFRMVQN